MKSTIELNAKYFDVLDWPFANEFDPQDDNAKDSIGDPANKLHLFYVIPSNILAELSCLVFEMTPNKWIK